MNRKLGIVITSAILLTSTIVPNVAIARSPNNRSSSIVSFQEATIPRGTRIPVQHDNDKIVIAPSEKRSLTLTVRDSVIRNNRLVIPAGTRIEGELRPAGDGSRFVAQTLVFRDGQRIEINARSGIVTRRETVRRSPRVGKVLTNAGIGAAAAAIIAGITGDRKIDALEVIGGAALGGATSFALNNRQTEVISIRPNEDLTLELRSDLALR
ncbi:S-layer domain-containing protein [Leptolyngbya sp. NIES-3755]|nr:S-layer domain-containing protein [Leptolyngbya sp. NIES-3755]